MRLGIQLDGAAGLARAEAADHLGLWAVSVSGVAGTEAILASRIAAATRNIRIVVWVDLDAEHPLTVAEEIAVLDNVSGGRVVVGIQHARNADVLGEFAEVLMGRERNGVVLAPPVVQTHVPIWMLSAIDGNTANQWPVVVTEPAALVRQAGRLAPGCMSLSGDLSTARATIDAWRVAGCTHLLVDWPGPLAVLARHLATRAASADFPQLVADLADRDY